jgi:hypothetical protein
MEDLDHIPHITNPLLYIFEGELVRIGLFIKEHLNDVVSDVVEFTGYGEMYGLYTHSHSAVAHVTTLRNAVNQTELQDAMSRRVEAKSNAYRLNLIGGWLTVLDTNLSVRELLQKKANTLSESETYFCVVVEKPRSKFPTEEDMSDPTQTFFLVKGNVYKMDKKILKQESPFRLDAEFTDEISSPLPEWSCPDGFEDIGTEMKDLSSKKSETDSGTKNSKNPIKHNSLPESQREIKNGQDTSVEDWVDVKLSDADRFCVSPDDKKESVCNGSLPEKICTSVNENKTVCVGAQRTQGNDKDIGKEDDVTNKADEDASTTTDQQDERKTVMESKGEEKEQQEVSGLSEETSTREDSNEKDFVPVAKQFQETESEMKTGIALTVETEMINENTENPSKDDDSENEKSQEKENEDNGDDKSNEPERPTPEPFVIVHHEMKTSSQSTEIPKDGSFEETSVTEDTSKDDVA